MSRPFESLLAYLHRVSLASTNCGTDTELLSRFVRSGDMVAFELLFWRHGPMVWAVCRRLLGNSPDAEDAFQATFLVLARKARSVGNGAALGGWLHRVARHTALNAQKSKSRRAAREQPLANVWEPVGQNDPSQQLAGNELKALIDEEIARLPDKFRLPLILCDMEGRTHEAAAAELKCPLGTLNSRLARGRDRLRESLRRRGVSMENMAGVPVPLAVAAAALRTLSQPPSAPVLALAEGVIWSLTCGAAKKVVGALAVCCLLVAGIAAGVAGGMMGEQDVPKKATPPAPVVQATPDEKLNFLDPDAGPLPPDAIARIGSLRFRHTDEVTGLAYSPDGKWLASISTGPDDLTARLWDAATGKEHLRVKVAVPEDLGKDAPQFAPGALGFSPDAKQFLVADATSIRSFDIATRKELLAHRFVADTQVHPIVARFAPDGKACVVAWRAGFVEIRDVATGAVQKTIVHTFKGFNYIDVTFAADGRRFALCSNIRQDIRVFDTASGQQVALVEASGKTIHQLLFLPAGDALVGLVYDAENSKSSVVFFEPKTGKPYRTVDVHRMTSVIAVSPDEKLVVAGNAQRTYSQQIDIASGKEISRIVSTSSPDKLAFSPDGKLLAGARHFSGAITVWDVASRRYHPAAAEPTFFFGTTFSSDGRTLVLPGFGPLVVDWRTGKIIRRLADVQPDAPFRPHLAPDHKLFAVAIGTGPIHLFDADTAKEVRTLTGHTEGAGSIVFSGDGGRLACCGFDEVIHVWDVVKNQEIAQFTPPGLNASDLHNLSISDNGRILAVSCDQKGEAELELLQILYIWDVDAKVQLARIKVSQRFFAPAVLSPDGGLLAGGGGDVIIWNAATGQEMHSLPGHGTNSILPGTWCSFSRNSQWLATGDTAGRLRLWEVMSGQEVYRFEGHHTGVRANFSPDGRLLVAASEDAPCFIWDVIGAVRAAQPADAVDLEQLWRDLADADAKNAFLAMRQLVARPERAVELIRKNLKPPAGIDGPKIDKLLRDLDSLTFAVRETAAAELVKVVEHIEPGLTKARATAPLEVRARIDRILEKATVPSPERLRQSRALGTLEFIATPAAAQLLDDLAVGNKLDSLTAAAAAASERLRARGVK
jgi:RNA polymerase sigma factor (sigma-70 family)